jgi:hypothetical protein
LGPEQEEGIRDEGKKPIAYHEAGDTLLATIYYLAAFPFRVNKDAMAHGAKRKYRCNIRLQIKGRVKENLFSLFCKSCMIR